jgi:trans-2,3-dihydro-3-hydroxyanthranilate isomerase
VTGVTTPRLLFPEPHPGEVEAAAGSGTFAYTLLDVFTNQPLEGNQLAIFTDARALTAEEMQRVARELNLSETVFLLAPEAGGDVHIRIFTPRTELPFAGHPVLGAAFVVGEAIGTEIVQLETGLGEIRVDLRHDGARLVFGRMHQPIPTWEPYEREAELLMALRVDRSVLPVEAYRNGPRHAFVMLESEAAVAALEPNISALRTHTGVGVSCFAGSGTQWKTRMFAPALGVSEDPATGSAAGPLVVHLARHGLVNWGDEIEIRQGVEIGRPSVLYARAIGSDAGVEGVEVGGSAVVVAQGVYLVRSARSS